MSKHEIFSEGTSGQSSRNVERLTPGLSLAQQHRSPMPEGAGSASNTMRFDRGGTSSRSPEMHLFNFKQSIYYAFLVQKLLRHLDVGRKSILPAWDLGEISPTTEDCTKALALAFYGKYHQQPDIVQQGSVWYSKALSQLKQDLYDDQNALSISVLLSTIALTLYEVRYSPRHALDISLKKQYMQSDLTDTCIHSGSSAHRFSGMDSTRWRSWSSP